MKKLFSTLMVIMTMAILGGSFGSCESNQADVMSDSSSVIVPLNFTFTWDTVTTGNSVTIKWKVTESVFGLSESGEAKVTCTHERDGYAGPREADVAYAQQHTTQGQLKTVTKSSTAKRKVYIDSATTTALSNCGNVIYCYRSQERIVVEINGKEYDLPYIKVDAPTLEKLGLLPGNAKTRGDDQFIADSVCKAPGWVAHCSIMNYAKDAGQFDVRPSDLFKVYQLEDNDIESGKIVGDNRVPLDETTERCDVIVEWTKKDKTVHEQTYSKVLNRRILTKPQWSVYVNEYGFAWQKDKDFAVGDASLVETDGDWTVYGRTDSHGALIANGKDTPVETEYGLYHEKAVYNNAKYGLSHTFDFVGFNPREKSTVEGDIEPYSDEYVRCPLVNTISTTYLDYAQDASETALLYKQNEQEEVVTFDDWDGVASFETTLDDQTIWHTEYLYIKGGKEERTVFEWIQGRTLVYLGPWTSIEENNSCETSGVVVERSSTETVEQEQRGAVAQWSVFTFDLHSVVQLNGSKQYDKWKATEGGDFSVTYRGKTLKLRRKGYIVNNQFDLTDDGVSGDYHEWGHSNTLEYKWGESTKTSKATGLIKVPQPQDRDKFFPPEWGDVEAAFQTVTNNVTHDGYNYCWSIHFTKGVLPVILGGGDSVPIFRFELFEYTSVKDYNSATYSGDAMWVNTVAADRAAQMVWEREGFECANKDYREAGRQNWDEGHKRDGHASVFTSRYKLDVEDGYLTATDTYTGILMGSWR